MNNQINHYANFISKQKRIENSGLLRSSPVQIDEFYDDTSYLASTVGGAAVGGATGWKLGTSASIATGQPHMYPLFGFFGAALGAAGGGIAGGALHALGANRLEKLKAKREFHIRNELDKHTYEQKDAAVNYIGDSLEEKHGVTVHRGAHDHIYIEGGPLKKNEYISFHDTHGMKKYNIPSFHKFVHHSIHKFKIGATGETQTVDKKPYDYSHEDFHRTVDHLDKYLHSLKLRNARNSNGSQ